MKIIASIEQKGADPVGTLMAHLLHSVTNGHILHLQSRSYAEHQALGTFYSEMGDLVDDFIESFQGKKAILLNYPQDYKLPPSNSLEYLQSLAAEVEEMRRAPGFPQDSELQNEIDSIANLINRTMYKLRFLK